jgi:hypothetical protein
MPGNSPEAATATSVGFAETSGNTTANRSLSENLANAAIRYLVTKHNLPLQTAAPTIRLLSSEACDGKHYGEGTSKKSAGRDQYTCELGHRRNY